MDKLASYKQRFGEGDEDEEEEDDEMDLEEDEEKHNLIYGDPAQLSLEQRIENARINSM